MTNDYQEEKSMTTDFSPATSKTSGWVVFAGLITAIASLANLVFGLSLLINDEWLVLTSDELLIFDFTTAGVIFMIFAAFQLFVAFGIFNGELWARVLGIIGASLGIITQMSFMSIYPQWAWLIIGIDALVIYALAVHGDDVSEW
jgi:hypothetical protein